MEMSRRLTKPFLQNIAASASETGRGSRYIGVNR